MNSRTATPRNRDNRAVIESLLPQIGLAAGAATASGLRLYGTVAALGLLHRLGALHLPAGLEVLSQLPIIILASALYVIEFVADKIPFLDSAWDAVHTVIRPAFGALIGDYQIGRQPEDMYFIEQMSHVAAAAHAPFPPAPRPSASWSCRAPFPTASRSTPRAGTRATARSTKSASPWE